MFTYLEVQTDTSKRVNHVRLTIEDSNVILKSLAGNDRGRQMRIPIDEIDWQVFDTYFGGKRWSFEYLGITWKIFEVGLGLFEYIQKNLPEQMSVRA